MILLLYSVAIEKFLEDVSLKMIDRIEDVLVIWFLCIVYQVLIPIWITCFSICNYVNSGVRYVVVYVYVYVCMCVCLCVCMCEWVTKLNHI